MTAFTIRKSQKNGISSPESYIVARANTSFLRLWGKHPAWTLVTATASEDSGRIQVCADQRRLVEAALRTCIEQGVAQPKVTIDQQRREFVEIGEVRQDPGESDDLVKEQLNAVIARFFEHFDGYEPPSTRGDAELRELYSALEHDEGSDVYLSDGLWLRSDGSLADNGC